MWRKRSSFGRQALLVASLFGLVIGFAGPGRAHEEGAAVQTSQEVLADLTQGLNVPVDLPVSTPSPERMRLALNYLAQQNAEARIRATLEEPYSRALYQFIQAAQLLPADQQPTAIRAFTQAFDDTSNLQVHAVVTRMATYIASRLSEVDLRDLIGWGATDLGVKLRTHPEAMTPEDRLGLAQYVTSHPGLIKMAPIWLGYQKMERENTISVNKAFLTDFQEKICRNLAAEDVKPPTCVELLAKRRLSHARRPD